MYRLLTESATPEALEAFDEHLHSPLTVADVEREQAALDYAMEVLG